MTVHLLECSLFLVLEAISSTGVVNLTCPYSRFLHVLGEKNWVIRLLKVSSQKARMLETMVALVLKTSWLHLHVPNPKQAETRTNTAP